MATNKTSGKSTSQLSSPLMDIDTSNDTLEAWADNRLVQTLGDRVATVAPMPVQNNGMSNVTPIINMTMPAIPQPTLNELELAFHKGADSQKRVTETIVPSGTRYTDAQLVHLMAFCGLDSSQRHKLPKIWTNLQGTKGWHDAAAELNKWFRTHEEEDSDDSP